jgi:hypothetical protein
MQIDDLILENQDIVDLKLVLNELISNEELMTNPVFCQLLTQFHHKVAAHLLHEDGSVYAELLKSKEKKINEIATQFLNNTVELKKFIATFSKHWCSSRSKTSKKEHKAFLVECKEVFQLVDERISLENKKLFPALRES